LDDPGSFSVPQKEHVFVVYALVNWRQACFALLCTAIALELIKLDLHDSSDASKLTALDDIVAFDIAQERTS
jgi:hypothetical protein